MSRRDGYDGGDRRSRSRRGFGAATSVAAWIGVALMPKCPLCVAVALSGLGVGAAWATGVSSYLRTGAWSVAVLALLSTLYVETRRFRARRDRAREETRFCSCG
jgi:hypothetical protein